jgi:hypothetical protein
LVRFPALNQVNPDCCSRNDIPLKRISLVTVSKSSYLRLALCNQHGVRNTPK